MGNAREIARRMAKAPTVGQDYFTPQQRERADAEVARIADLVATEINRVSPEIHAMDPQGVHPWQGLLEELIAELQERV